MTYSIKCYYIYVDVITRTSDVLLIWTNIIDLSETLDIVYNVGGRHYTSNEYIAIDSTVVTESSTDTLTNKTINFENNTAIVELAVTVVNPGSGNVYYLDGEATANVQLIPGVTYRFDQSDSSNSGHPLLFLLQRMVHTEEDRLYNWCYTPRIQVQQVHIHK